MKYFLPAKKTTITGIIQITAHARSSPQRVISLKLPLNIANPTGRVLIPSLLVTINGHIKLFQFKTNVKMVKVTTAGKARGKQILKNVWNKLQPSSNADSSNSFGKPKKNCLIINIPKPPNNAGRINAEYVFTICNSLIKKNRGIIFTWGGIIIVKRIIKNKTFLPLKSNLAKAYPAKLAIKTWPIVDKTATIKEFRK